MKNLLFIVSAIACAFLFSQCSTTKDNKASAIPKDVSSFVNQQVDVSNTWKSGDGIPAFVFDTIFSVHRYPQLSQFGGITPIAIIDKVTNKDFLVRLITGCEDELDIPFASSNLSDSVPINGLNRYQYYSNLTIRYAAKRKYQLAYSTEELGKRLAELNTPKCNVEILFMHNGLQQMHQQITRVDSNDRLIKGSIYVIGLSDEYKSATKDTTTKKYKPQDPVISNTAQTLTEAFKTWRPNSGKTDADSMVMASLRAMPQGAFKTINWKYTGPYFSETQQDYIHKRIIEIAMKLNRQPPFDVISVIAGQVVVIFVEDIR